MQSPPIFFPLYSPKRNFCTPPPFELRRLSSRTVRPLLKYCACALSRIVACCKLAFNHRKREIPSIIREENIQKMSREWSNGIFSCFNDCSTCILAYFIPCYVFGKNAEAVGDSCFLCAISQLVPFLSLGTRVYIRGKLRKQRGIDGSVIHDLLCVWGCCLCAMVQEAQEVKSPVGLGIARE